MPVPPAIVLPSSDLPRERGWLARQGAVVLAWGEQGSDNADIVVGREAELEPLLAAIERCPLAALALVQVLRTVEGMPLPLALNVESLAYGVLQGGPEYRAWLDARDEAPTLVRGDPAQPAILATRAGGVIDAQLNRPGTRNSITVEMRDALVELLELVVLDSSIERLNLGGRGGCFSVGGELREFGLATDPATAHAIRSRHHPGRLMAQCAGRVHCHLHSACIGSGIEIPAFAAHLSAAPRSFFQLPELGFGLIPGAGGCVSISRRIGRQRTAWMALSGRRVGVEQALDWGLVDEIRESA